MTASISLIAALARNRVIGRDNRLPWRLPADLRFFKHTTMGKPLLMGRRTWESIGRPLPGRRMIVLSRDLTYTAAGCEVAQSLDEALAIAGTAAEVMVIGGATLYTQALPSADRLYLTRVDGDIRGDVEFPNWNPHEWRLVWEEMHSPDAEHLWPYRFQRWERIKDVF